MARGGARARVAASYSAEELQQQWAFLDSLVQRQAASLRAGVQDPEEDEPVMTLLAAPDESLLRELDALRQNTGELAQLRSSVLELEVLRQKVLELEPLQESVRELEFLRRRVERLEAERGALLERLHEAELAHAARQLRPARHRLPSWLRRERR
jgi:hypothetical protein